MSTAKCKPQNKKPPKASRKRLSLVWLVVATVLALGLGAWWLAARGQVAPSQDAGLGQLGGDLHALSFAPEGRILYGQHAGLQISSDGGRSWTRPSNTGDAMAIASSPAQPEVIYQAGHDLFLKSTDGGETWTEPGFGNLPGTDIHGFAVAPENGWLYANIAGRGLYRSTGSDDTWEFVSPATAGAMALSAGPGTPAVLYAATMDRGLIRSSDGGESWQPVTPPGGVSMSGLYAHPVSGTLYLAGQEGIYRSADQGQSWETLGPDVPMALVAANADDERELVGVSQQGQVYRSDDGGETWLE